MQGDSATFNRILARSLNDREYTFTFRATDHMANASRWLTTEIHASEAIEHDTTVIRQIALTNDGLHFCQLNTSFFVNYYSTVVVIFRRYHFASVNFGSFTMSSSSLE
ncbi:hypothetical protein BCC0191_000251 [Burkholderia ambifaria]